MVESRSSAEAILIPKGTCQSKQVATKCGVLGTDLIAIRCHVGCISAVRTLQESFFSKTSFGKIEFMKRV